MLGASWTCGRITWSTTISPISFGCEKQLSKHCTIGAAVKLLGFQAMPKRGSGKGICKLWLVASFVPSCVDYPWLYVLWVFPDILVQNKNLTTEQTKSGISILGKGNCKLGVVPSFVDPWVLRFLLHRWYEITNLMKTEWNSLVFIRVRGARVSGFP